MLEQSAPISSLVQATYKVREAEGILDRYFYRKIGFRLAQFFAKLGMTPVAVTLLGGLFGITAGHFYFYRDLRLNIAGMILDRVPARPVLCKIGNDAGGGDASRRSIWNHRGTFLFLSGFTTKHRRHDSACLCKCSRQCGRPTCSYNRPGK